MFTFDDLQSLLDLQPFVPFRLFLSDGGSVEVRSREQVMPLRRFVLVALLDPKAIDRPYDRFTVVWYLHVSRYEMLGPGTPPFSPPSGPAGTPSPTPA
jgi:hypothetical protein